MSLAKIVQIRNPDAESMPSQGKVWHKLVREQLDTKQNKMCEVDTRGFNQPKFGHVTKLICLSSLRLCKGMIIRLDHSKA